MKQTRSTVWCNYWTPVKCTRAFATCSWELINLAKRTKNCEYWIVQPSLNVDSTNFEVRFSPSISLHIQTDRLAALCIKHCVNFSIHVTTVSRHHLSRSFQTRRRRKQLACGYAREACLYCSFLMWNLRRHHRTIPTVLSILHFGNTRRTWFGLEGRGEGGSCGGRGGGGGGGIRVKKILTINSCRKKMHLDQGNWI